MNSTAEFIDWTETDSGSRGRTVDTLGLSLRTLRVLKGRGIGTAGVLAEHTIIDLLHFKGFGRKAITDVVAALRRVGLSPKGERPVSFASVGEFSWESIQVGALIEGKAFSSAAMVAVPREVFQPAVYFLFDGPRLMYVGQSAVPGQRFAGHREKTFTHAVILPTPTEKLLEVEATLIRALRPPLNGPMTVSKTPRRRSDG